MNDTEEKKVSEEITKVGEATEVKVTGDSPAVPAKKKNVAMIIISSILGIGLLCSLCAGVGIYSLYKGMQNGDEATVVKKLFNSLDTGDKQGVLAVSGEKLYADLYTESDGTSLAEEFKGAFESLTVSSVSTENNTAELHFTIEGKGPNKSFIETVKRAKLQKDESGWFVTYFGPESAE